MSPDYQYSKAFLTAYEKPDKTFIITCGSQDEARSLRFRLMNFVKKVQKAREKPNCTYVPAILAAIDNIGISQSGHMITLSSKSHLAPLKSLEIALQKEETVKGNQETRITESQNEVMNRLYGNSNQLTKRGNENE